MKNEKSAANAACVFSKAAVLNDGEDVRDVAREFDIISAERRAVWIRSGMRL